MFSRALFISERLTPNSPTIKLLALISSKKKPPSTLTYREVRVQAEHYEEKLLGGITPGGS
jgi:hypothetical protein